MAANRIKGITIEIDGNSTKLQESLKDVNASLKNTQTQLNDVNKLLKLDPKNMNLLTQKQELLAKQTDNVADKLKKLREAQEQMKAAGIDAMSEDYMKVEREIIDCENEQKRLTEEAQKTDEAIVKIGSGFDKVAEKAKSAADATAPISKAAAAGLAGMTGLAVKAAESADEINTLSKQSGIATDTIQKMQFAADRLDVDFNSAVNSIAKLKKGLDKNEATLSDMGVSIRDANGQYRDMESIFFDTIAALSQIENETERDKVAMDLFGRSADELAGYIDDGGAAFRELSAQAEASGAIISEEDLQKANEFNDTLDQLKATVGADLMKAGASIGQALLPVLEKVSDFITKVVDGFANLSPTMQGVIMVVLALVAALSPVLSLVATICTILPVVSTLTMATVAPILGVIAAIAAVIAIIVILVKHWDDIKAKAIEIWEKIKEVWEGIKQTIKEKIDAIKEKIETLKEGFQSLVDRVKSIWETIKGVLSGELPMPKIKMPHITVTGKFSLDPPSAPKFGIQWYKKAMDDAYILNSPTIFGASGGNLLGAGEAGSETIVGTDKLMSMIAEAVGSTQVNVVLEGDAKGVFNLVRAENSRYMKSNSGYSPLMN